MMGLPIEERMKRHLVAIQTYNDIMDWIGTTEIDFHITQLYKKLEEETRTKGVLNVDEVYIEELHDELLRLSGNNKLLLDRLNDETYNKNINFSIKCLNDKLYYGKLKEDL